MPFEKMTCPNCGAALEYQTGATTLVCKFCATTLRLKADVSASGDPYRSLADADAIRALVRNHQKAEAIRLYMEQTGASLAEARQAVAELVAGRAPQYLNSTVGPFAVDIDAITALLARGQKIEAIKLLREQTQIDLKAAKDAVEAIERGELPTLTINQRTRSGAKVSRYRGCVLGCLPLLGFIGLCFVSIMLLSQFMFRAWGPYDAALTLVRGNAEVVAALGSPINTGLMLTGSLSSSGSDSSARFETPISGSRRNGTLRVSGSSHNGRWDLSIWVLYDEDNEERTIYLSARP